MEGWSRSYDGHHQITTFFIVHKFGSQKFLPDRNLALKYHKTLLMRSLRWMRLRKATYLGDDLRCKTSFGGRWPSFSGRGPLVEDNFWWKTIFSGRHLRWKTSFGGRWTLAEDDFRWKTTFGQRWRSVEDDLWGKTTISERWPSVEDGHRWKTTISGRGPLVEDDHRWRTTIDGSRPSVEDTFGRRQPFVEDNLWSNTRK